MNEQVMAILAKKWVIPTAVGVASFATGGVVGYFIGKRNGDVFDLDIEGFEEFFGDPNQGTLFDTEDQNTFSNSYQDNYVQSTNIPKHIRIPVEDDYDLITWEDEEEADLMLGEDEEADAAAEQDALQAELEANLDALQAPEVHNVFSGSDSQWDYPAELALRSRLEPYVIHADEFVADEADCDQSTITYYEGDDIVADQFDTPMYDYNKALGPLKWGHGSNDPSVVYIRNEAMNMEFEVLRHTGRFEIEVLGHDVENAYAARELKHSVPRFRDE